MVMIPPFLLTALKTNQFFQTGIIFGGLALCWKTVQGWFNTVSRYIRNKFTYTVELDSTSDAYDMFISWVTNIAYGKKATVLYLGSNYIMGQTKPIYELGFGNHTFKHNKKRLWVDITKVEPAGNNSFIKKQVKIRVFWSNRKFLNDLFMEIYRAHSMDHAGKIPILKVDSYEGHTRISSYTSPRNPITVITKGNILGSIISDIDWFLTQKGWYNTHQLAHQRGYLLEGPPGNGKSSIIRAIATAMDCPILNLSVEDAKASTLAAAFRYAPEKCVIVLEDIDSLFIEKKSRIEPSDEEEPALVRTPTYNRETIMGTSPLSSILNVLDGIEVSERTRIIIMTTNRIEQLDSALIRPGRIDRIEYIGNATHDMICQLYLTFFPEHTTVQAMEFAEQFVEEERSMAYIQEQLIIKREAIEKQKLLLQTI